MEVSCGSWALKKGVGCLTLRLLGGARGLKTGDFGVKQVDRADRSSIDNIDRSWPIS